MLLILYYLVCSLTFRWSKAADCNCKGNFKGWLELGNNIKLQYYESAVLYPRDFIEAGKYFFLI